MPFLMAPQDVGFSAVLQSISSVRSYLRQSTELLPSRFLQLPFPAGFVPVNTEQSLTAGKILLLGAAPYYVYMGQSKCHKTTKGIHISCAHPSPRGRASPWCCNPISSGAGGLCGLDGALLAAVGTSSEGDEDEALGLLQKEGLQEGLRARELPVMGRVLLCVQWGCSRCSQAQQTDGAIHGVALLSSEEHVGMEALAPAIAREA